MSDAKIINVLADAVSDLLAIDRGEYPSERAMKIAAALDANGLTIVEKETPQPKSQPLTRGER